MRRGLRFWEAVALSVAIMAPGAVLALNGTVVAGLVGRAVPLVFAISAVGILFVAYAFVRLAGFFEHAGSVYALSGATLGPRAGFFSGWALLGTYLCLTAGSIAEVGLFGREFLRAAGLPLIDWIFMALVAAAVIWLLAYGNVRVVTRALLGMEGLTVALILALVALILFRIFGGSAPGNQEFTYAAFTLPDGVDLGMVGLATVFGLLAFGGFEGAASLGEETDDPRRNIPRAIAAAVLTTGVLYVLVMFVQTLGFGVDGGGPERFAASASPLGELSTSYAGPGMAAAINLGVMVSAFASGLGSATAGSRILFALCRDGFLSRRLGETSPRTGSPANALAVVMAVSIVTFVALRLGGVSAVNAFFYPATVGVLSLLVAYVVTNVGAVRFFLRSGRVGTWEAVVPIAGLAILAYVLYNNVYPPPDPPFGLFPYIAGAWLLIGLATVLLVPGLARRMGASLAGRGESGDDAGP